MKKLILTLACGTAFLALTTTARATDPNQPVCTKPNTPVFTKPNQPVFTRPNCPTQPRPNAPVFVKPNQPVYTKPNQPVFTKPNVPVPGKPGVAAYGQQTNQGVSVSVTARPSQQAVPPGVQWASGQYTQVRQGPPARTQAPLSGQLQQLRQGQLPAQQQRLG